MRAYYDVDLGIFIVGPGTTIPLPAFSQKRSPNTSLEVQMFHTNSATPIELPSGATGVFEIKEDGKFDANAIAGASFWTKTGSGASTLYTFVYSSMTPALNKLLGINDPTTVTVVAATDIFTAASHGLAIGNRIQFTSSGTLPAGLLANTDYFIVSDGFTSNAFKVSLTDAGAVVDVTDTGTGTHKFSRIDNDQVQISLMAAMQYVADGKTNESANVDYVLLNDIVRDTDTPPTTIIQDVVLNVRAGKPAITNGNDFIDIVFASAFGSGANVVVTGGVSKPSGGDNIFATLREDSVSETGCRFELSAAVPATGYKLHYQAVQI